MGTDSISAASYAWKSIANLIYPSEVTMTLNLVDEKEIDRVIFNDPATIIYWKDGKKTVVKCQPGDEYDKEKGFMAAVMKKLYGNDNTFNKVIRKWCEEDE